MKLLNRRHNFVRENYVWPSISKLCIHTSISLFTPVWQLEDSVLFNFLYIAYILKCFSIYLTSPWKLADIRSPSHYHWKTSDPILIIDKDTVPYPALPVYQEKLILELQWTASSLMTDDIQEAPACASLDSVIIKCYKNFNNCLYKLILNIHKYYTTVQPAGDWMNPANCFC